MDTILNSNNLIPQINPVQPENILMALPSNGEEEEIGTNTLTTSSSYLNGRWTYEEHIRFLKGCLLYGNNWKKVENYVKSRTSSQIRSHAQKFLIKLNKKYKVNLNSPFSHSQKYIKNAKHKLSNEAIEEMLENLSKPVVDMDSVEKVILNIFFMNGTDGTVEIKNKNDDDSMKRQLIDEISDLESDYKRKIFSCEKIPKDSPLKKEILNCLESNEPEDLQKIILWMSSDNIKIKSMIKSICLSEKMQVINNKSNISYLNPYYYYWLYYSRNNYNGNPNYLS